MKNNTNILVLSVLLCLCVAIPAGAATGEVTYAGGTVVPEAVLMTDIDPAFESYPAGYIPAPYTIADRTPLTNPFFATVDGLRLTAEEPLPAVYDLRDSERMTSVKNQGECGSCWTFATLASLESYLRGEGGTACDFSENNMKNTHGFNKGPCDGGNYEMATAYLTRWSVPDGVTWYAGPVAEADDPYDPVSGLSPAAPPLQKHVQNVYYLPVQSAGENVLVKSILREYGAVGAYITYNRTLALNMSGSAPSYYYNASAGMADQGGHAIALAGWDDTYPKERFTVTPPGDGAYLAKNSWGSTWGSDGGYFYISYYDETINDGMTLFTADETDNYDSVYYHDAFGATTFAGLGTPTGTFANVFTAAGNESIEACGVYTYEAGAEVDVAIYLNPLSGPESPVTGPVSTESKTPAFAGYHTIPLAAPVNISTGETFSVVVTVTNPSASYTLPLEVAIDGYSSGATSAAGESYYRNHAGEWIDTYDETGWNRANVCIKAYTTERSAPAAPVANFTASPVNGTAALTVAFTDISTGSPTGWNWTFGDGGTATDQHPSHTYTVTGTYNVSLTVENAAGTDSRTEAALITVMPASPTARFDFNRNAVALTENNTFTPGTYVTNYTYRLHAENIDATATLGNLSYVAAAENITWVDNQGFAVWNSSCAAWTFPASTVIGPGESLDVRAGTATSTETVYAHTLERVCNVTLFRTNGVQRTNVTVTFDDLAFESVFLGFAAAKDANVTTTIIPGSVVTNAPLADPLPGGGDYHLKLDTAALTAGTEYYVTFDTQVSLNGTAVIHKPLVYVWEGISHVSADLGETVTAAVPAAMLPADAAEFSVTTNTSCEWSVVRQNNVLSVLEGALTPVATAVPVANFTAAPVNGTAPLTVVFTDLSTGGPAAWNWTFGDGGTSGDQHPTHIYTAAGTYTVSLTVENAAGTDTLTKSALVAVASPAPTARFDLNRNFVVLTENNTFTPGTYAADLVYRLHAENTDATATLGNLSYVAAVMNISWVDDPLFATWNSSYAEWILPASRLLGPGSGYDERAGTAYAEDHVYNHTITRVNNVSLFRTDGVQHTNVTVTFDDLAFESVFLCVAGADNANVTATVIPASVLTNAPVTSTVVTGGLYRLELDTAGLVAGSEYFFSLNSRITLKGTPVVYKPLVYVWEGMSHDRADLGETFTASLPTAMLPADATAFSVTTNTSCNWSVVRQNNLLSVIEGRSLAVNSTPVANFTAVPCVGASPLQVNFTDLSMGDVTSWFWTFGDGTNATTQHPVHTYTADGRYTVTLTVNEGADTCTKTGCIRAISLLLGDANGDGTVNQVDTLHVLKEIVGMSSVPASGTDAFIRTDVHENGFVEVGDAMFIAQYNVGLRDRWFVLG